jgi:hypothetical protein
MIIYELPSLYHPCFMFLGAGLVSFVRVDSLHFHLGGSSSILFFLTFEAYLWGELKDTQRFSKSHV